MKNNKSPNFIKIIFFFLFLFGLWGFGVAMDLGLRWVDGVAARRFLGVPMGFGDCRFSLL